MGGSSSKNEDKAQEEGKRIDERVIHAHAPPFPEVYSKKLYNSIVKINFTVNEETLIGTGFFLRLNFSNKIKKYLVTCYHIIKEKFVDEKIVIHFYHGELNKEKRFEIKLDENERYIKCFDKPIDVTLIGITEKDNIKEDKFLQLDYNYKNGYNSYINEFFYLAGYPQNNLMETGRSSSSGKITKISDNLEFEHNIDTYFGNSGSPICLANNQLLAVGIHKEGNTIEPKNYGTFLGYVFDILEKEENENKFMNNSKNKNEEIIKIKEIDRLKNKEVRIDDKINYETKKNEKKNTYKFESDNFDKSRMFKNTKLMNILFSYLDEKRKLKIIKYNKNLQQMNEISLFNYIILSGRYIEYESKTKGKEYNWGNVLIYEGEFLNGERNGKGKEYNNDGDLIFEGEYSNGKRWNGKGIIKKDFYFGYNFTLLDFEYKNGNLDGKVKEYYLVNNYYNLSFEGEYSNGNKNGKAKEYYKNGKLRFEGEYLNGKKWNGKGYDRFDNIIYEIKNGQGHIKKYHRGGDLDFEGDYLNGKKN